MADNFGVAVGLGAVGNFFEAQSRLVQQLWDEIAAEATDLPLTAAQKALLDARIDEHEASPDDVEPWDQARDEILRES